MKKSYSEITPYIKEMAKLSGKNNTIKADMYTKHNVFRGLRDLNGNGVVTGLTEISSIKSKETGANGEAISCDGKLSYRGIDVNELVSGFMHDNRLGYEETVYLLLFSELPNKEQLKTFKSTLAQMRSLPDSFVRDMILKAPGQNMMNILARCVGIIRL